MVAPLPLAKIGLLVLKRLTKPLANIIKNEAKKHPEFRKHIIIPIGRACGWIENQATYEVIKGKQRYRPMPDNEAVELGADAVGEIIVIGMLTIILFAEYSRQGEIKASAKRTKSEEFTNLVDSVIDIISDLETLKNTVKKIEADLAIDPISEFDNKVLEENKVLHFDWEIN